MNAQNSISSGWGLAHFMMGYNEQSELEGLKNLDSQVIGAVYDRFFPDVYRYVYYRLGDEQVAGRRPILRDGCWQPHPTR